MGTLKYLFKEGIRSLWANKLMTISSLGVLISCLILTGISTLFVVNINQLFGNIESQNVMQVYLEDGLSEEQVSRLRTIFSDMENVIGQPTYVSQEEAIEEFKARGNDVEALFGDIENNSILPASFKLTMKDLTKYDETFEEISQMEEVYAINDQRSLAENIVGLRNIISSVSIWIIGILGIVSLVIISNTIRITMHDRRLEISIMKSVGATDSFVTFPFVVEGLILGIMSALLSFFVLWYVYVSVDRSMMESQGWPIIAFERVAFPIIAVFVIVGILAGVVGSAISIRRYLKSGGGNIYDIA